MNAIGWVNDVEAFDGVLQERGMFVRVQEQLYGLPSDEALCGQCWDGRWRIGVFFWL